MEYHTLEDLIVMEEKFKGLQAALHGSKEIFGNLKETYVKAYKSVTDIDDTREKEYEAHVFYIGEILGVSHLLLVLSAGYIKHEIVKCNVDITLTPSDQIDFEIFMITEDVLNDGDLLAYAVEDYMLYKLRFARAYIDYMKVSNVHAARWQKIDLISKVAYAIAASSCISNTQLSEETYGAITKVADFIRNDGSYYSISNPHSHMHGTLDIAAAIEEYNLNIDEVYDRAVSLLYL